MISRGRTLSLLLVAAAAAAALGAPGVARAQSKSDIFAGKIPSVSGQLYRKAGRLELTAAGDLSLNDAFFNKYFGALAIGWHFNERFSVAARASGGFATRTGSAVVCSPGTGCEEAEDRNLWQVPGRVRMVVGGEVAWAPVYGKLNVLAERVAHFDLSIAAGADAVFHDEVLSRGEADQLAAAGGTPSSTVSPGVHVGIGARVFLREWIAVRLEVRDLVYRVVVPNAGSGGDTQNQIFAQVGVSFFLPAQNRPLR